MKDYISNKESSCLMYWDVNNLYWWAMVPWSQKLPVDGFEWRKDKFTVYNEELIKGYDEDSDRDTYSKSILLIPKGYTNYSDLPFLPETMKFDKYEKLVCNL